MSDEEKEELEEKTTMSNPRFLYTHEEFESVFRSYRDTTATLAFFNCDQKGVKNDSKVFNQLWWICRL